MELSLQGRCALVTGASAGLGAHFAHTLADAGARVWIAARRVDRLQALQAELRERGAKVDCVAMDVTSSAGVAIRP